MIRSFVPFPIRTQIPADEALCQSVQSLPVIHTPLRAAAPARDRSDLPCPVRPRCGPVFSPFRVTRDPVRPDGACLVLLTRISCSVSALRHAQQHDEVASRARGISFRDEQIVFREEGNHDVQR